MNRTEQQQQQPLQSESHLENLSAPQNEQPSAGQDDAVKGGIIIVGGSPSALLKPSYASYVYYSTAYSI
ncbi:MAG TPA: hypothetical protein VKA84_17940 [Gemmatimonadaceae bacterium]|nr:hypothetical protein [Gemmatimonadaceae bacterium]